MRTLLQQGDVSSILTALHALDAGNDKDKVICTAISYFQTHQARMQYDQFRSEGLPLGSGSIESGVRQIVNLRLKGASLLRIGHSVRPGPVGRREWEDAMPP
jgi:hypothetical protein